jgi:hypothetical protein
VGEGWSVMMRLRQLAMIVVVRGGWTSSVGFRAFVGDRPVLFQPALAMLCQLTSLWGLAIFVILTLTVRPFSSSQSDGPTHIKQTWSFVCKTLSFSSPPHPLPVSSLQDVVIFLSPSSSVGFVPPPLLHSVTLVVGRLVRSLPALEPRLRLTCGPIMPLAR